MTVAHLEPGNRIRLPPEWTEALGIGQLVLLDRTDQGILIRPCPAVTWDEIFANRLTVKPASTDTDKEDVEVTGDDYLF